MQEPNEMQSGEVAVTKETFQNDRGEKLVGMFHDRGNSSAIIILCHGYLANKDMCNFPKLAQALCRAGLSAFRFDHPCAWNGESERQGPFLMGNHDDEVSDIKAAVSFLRSKARRVIGILGHSKGGINVIQYAAIIGDVPKVINLAGRFCVRDGFLQRFGADMLDRLSKEKRILRKEENGFEWWMTEEDVLQRINRPMNDYAQQIRDRDDVALLCLHGKADTTIPWQESEECATRAGAELALVGGNHNFTRPEHADEMIARVVAFFSS